MIAVLYHHIDTPTALPYPYPNPIVPLTIPQRLLKLPILYISMRQSVVIFFDDSSTLF